MSKLEELIAALCPDGVEYKELNEIGIMVRGNGLQKKDFTDGGVGCIHYGQIYTYYKNFADETKSFVSLENAKKLKKVTCGDLIIAITSENTEDVCKCVAWLGDNEIVTGGHTAIFKHNQDSKYLVYCLQTEEFFAQKKKIVSGTKVIEVSPKKLEKVKIPLPPLEIQREIVRILDNFTELIAELIARKKQYEYYLEKMIYNPAWTVGTILDMLEQPITDGPHETPTFVEKGVPFISVESICDSKIDLNKKRGFITKEYDDVCARKYKPKRNDVYMVKSGSTTGKVAIVDFDEDFNIWSPIAAMRTNGDNHPRFLYHLLKSKAIQTQVLKKASHGSQPNLGMRELEKFIVHIPSLFEQQRIVGILDRFDALCNDLTMGLPAEIEARQKQYEYYRDKLLSFKEKK